MKLKSEIEEIINKSAYDGGHDVLLSQYVDDILDAFKRAIEAAEPINRDNNALQGTPEAAEIMGRNDGISEYKSNLLKQL